MSQFDDDREEYEQRQIAEIALAEMRRRVAQEKIKRYRKLKHEVRPSMLERIWQYINAGWRKK